MQNARYYLWELARYVVLTASFIMGFIIWSDSSNWVGAIDADEDRLHVSGPVSISIFGGGGRGRGRRQYFSRVVCST